MIIYTKKQINDILALLTIQLLYLRFSLPIIKDYKEVNISNKSKN